MPLEAEGEPLHVDVLLPWGGQGALTYLWPVSRLGPPVPGLRVEVPLGRARRVGIVLGPAGKEEDVPLTPLRDVVAVLDSVPLWTRDVLSLVLWASGYHHVSPGAFLRHALPPGLRRLERKAGVSDEGRASFATMTATSEEPPVPGVDDAALVSAKAFERAALLRRLETGDPLLPVLASSTAEARVDLYCEACERLLRRGRSVLVLAPERTRAETILAAFSAARLPATYYGADLTPRRRSALWREAAAGDHPLVVGLRTALFLPRRALGLIVVDDEHSENHREEGGVAYQARDLAIVRARFARAALLLGSSTPSLETIRNLRRRRLARVRLRDEDPRPIRLRRSDPRRSGTTGGLTGATLEAIDRHLAGGGRVALYLNRRGYARALVCPDCQWVARCGRCGTEMAVHLTLVALLCPRCARREALPLHCPRCHAALQPRGKGIERLVHVLRARYPREDVVACEAARRDVSLEARLVVGTRHLRTHLVSCPVSLLVVVDADQALVSPVLRSRERFAQDCFTLFALLRPLGSQRPEVIVQSRGADEEALAALLRGPYGRFARFEDESRRRGKLPPYTAWALVELGGRDEEEVLTALERIRDDVVAGSTKGVDAFGPLPLPPARGRGARARLLLQAATRPPLHRLLDELTPVLCNAGRNSRLQARVLVDPEDVL